MIRSAVVVLTALAFSGGPILAQTPDGLAPTDETEATRVGTRAANFLNLYVGARAQAMGGAGSSLAYGVSALYWNTAATAFDDNTHVGFSLSNLYHDLDIQHLFAGVILPVGLSRFSVSINHLTSGEIIRTDEEFPDGGNPQFGNTFEWSGTALGIHYSRLITDRLGIGLAAKFITEGISGAQANFVAADLSIMFETGLLGTRIGAALVNIGSEARVDGALVRSRIDQTTSTANVFETRRILDASLLTREVELPTAFRFGASTEIVGGPNSLLMVAPDHHAVLALDVSDRVDSPLSPSVGVEYGFRERLFLRVGKQWASEQQIERKFVNLLSVGGGLSLPLSEGRRILFDYAYTNYDDLNNVQTFSIEFAL